MIPYGLNPFGLEERKLTFHYIVNGVEDMSARTEYMNRMYCWAYIPKVLRDSYGFDWSITMASDQANWYSLPKYRSKQVEPLDSGNMSDGTVWEADAYWGSESAGNLLMVDGDLDLYFHLFFDLSVPEYATVFVIDTSGSMKDNSTVGPGSSKDYQKCMLAMASAIQEYMCMETNSDNARIFIYSGTYVNTIQCMLGTLNVGSNNYLNEYNIPVVGVGTDKEIIKLVQNMRKIGGSEAMITCLYYAIADVHRYLFENTNPDDNIVIGKTQLKGITFILLTDESIFTDDTLNDVDKLKTLYSGWYKSWQDTSVKPLPTNLPSSTTNKQTFADNINLALRQMSYYYGINMTWGLVDGLSSHSDINLSSGKGSMYDKIPIIKIEDLNTNYLTKTGEFDFTKYDGTIRFTYGDWIMPSSFHVQSPYNFMYKIQFNVPSGITMKSSYVLSDSDQYTSETNIKGKFHKDGNSYFTFRFPQFAGQGYVDSVAMPNVGMFNNCPAGSQWVKKKDSSIYSSASYIPSYDDVSTAFGWTNLSTIEFELVVSIYTITVDSNGGSGGSASPSTYQISTSSQSSTLTRPSRDGYTFSNWTKVSGPGNISGDTLTIPANSTGDITVKANWVTNVTVTYHQNPPTSKLNIVFGKCLPNGSAHNSAISGFYVFGQDSTIDVGYYKDGYFTSLIEGKYGSGYNLYEIGKMNDSSGIITSREVNMPTDASSIMAFRVTGHMFDDVMGKTSCPTDYWSQNNSKIFKIPSDLLITEHDGSKKIVIYMLPYLTKLVVNEPQCHIYAGDQNLTGAYNQDSYLIG